MLNIVISALVGALISSLVIPSIISFGKGRSHRVNKTQQKTFDATFMILLCVFFVCATVIFYMPNFIVGDNSWLKVKSYLNTGVIGDTIGGTTAPFIGI